MDDTDEWGPWEQRFPSLARLSARRRILAPKQSATVLRPFSIRKSHRKPETKSPFPAKSICMIDCFNQTFDTRRQFKRRRVGRKGAQDSSCEERPPTKPDFRSTMRIQSIPRGRHNNLKLSTEKLRPAAQVMPSPKAFTRTLFSTFSPISLALSQTQVLKQETSKVLAGKFQRSQIPTEEKDNPLLDALETRLTQLLETHRKSSLS